MRVIIAAGMCSDDGREETVTDIVHLEEGLHTRDALSISVWRSGSQAVLSQFLFEGVLRYQPPL